jgi:uncharacterized membrane protein YphA (DoxX/SURF4 family)
MNLVLWIVQALLAALFLFAGCMKFIMPVEEMTKQIAMPVWFLYFIGVSEVLGALGLILPWLLGIKPWLTPLAAVGLLIIMIGAMVTTLITGDYANAAFPAAAGLFSALVASGRSRKARV